MASPLPARSLALEFARSAPAMGDGLRVAVAGVGVAVAVYCVGVSVYCVALVLMGVELVARGVYCSLNACGAAVVHAAPT